VNCASDNPNFQGNIVYNSPNLDVVRLGESSKAQPVEGDSAKQEAEVEVGVPGGDIHNFMVPERNHEPGQKRRGANLTHPNGGTAKRLLKITPSRARLGACSVGLEIRKFAVFRSTEPCLR